eukprot:5990675-Alexandrium_andersonii.AAC.1
MSASLVGSEMCIRDRSSADAEAVAPTLSSCPSEPLPHDCFASCPGVAPVSYTHLTLPTICSV